jgi:hypothetical protein
MGKIWSFIKGAWKWIGALFVAAFGFVLYLYRRAVLNLKIARIERDAAIRSAQRERDLAAKNAAIGADADAKRQILIEAVKTDAKRVLIETERVSKMTDGELSSEINRRFVDGIIEDHEAEQ